MGKWGFLPPCSGGRGKLQVGASWVICYQACRILVFILIEMHIDPVYYTG